MASQLSTLGLADASRSWPGFRVKKILNDSLTRRETVLYIAPMSAIDHSTKLFNTAIIATKIPKLANYSTELNTLVQGKSFQAILKAIQEYARTTGIPEDQAAEEIVQTFRDIDRIWDDYIFQEGLDKLKNQLTN